MEGTQDRSTARGLSQIIPTRRKSDFHRKREWYRNPIQHPSRLRLIPQLIQTEYRSSEAPNYRPSASLSTVIRFRSGTGNALPVAEKVKREILVQRRHAFPGSRDTARERINYALDTGHSKVRVSLRVP